MDTERKFGFVSRSSWSPSYNGKKKNKKQNKQIQSTRGENDMQQ